MYSSTSCRSTYKSLCIPPLAAGPSNLAVTQNPSEIHLSAGDTAEIACVWEKYAERYRLIWYHNKQNTTKSISSTICFVSNTTHECKDVLKIKSASVSDSGTYYCEVIVEIPLCKRGRGNGTAVTVGKQGKLARTYGCHFICQKGSPNYSIYFLLLPHPSLNDEDLRRNKTNTEGI